MYAYLLKKFIKGKFVILITLYLFSVYSNPLINISNICLNQKGTIDPRCKCQKKRNCLSSLKNNNKDPLYQIIGFFSYNDFKDQSSFKKLSYKAKDLSSISRNENFQKIIIESGNIGNEIMRKELDYYNKIGQESYTKDFSKTLKENERIEYLENIALLNNYLSSSPKIKNTLAIKKNKPIKRIEIEKIKESSDMEI